MSDDLNHNDNPHRKLEKNIFILLCFIVAVTAIGGMIEILPLFKKEVAIEVVSGMRPYTPLELAGFNLYKEKDVTTAIANR